MSSSPTLVLLDADVFYPVILAKRAKREHPVYSKLKKQRHRPIQNTWLSKHYKGMIAKVEGEFSLRYIDLFYDQIQYKKVSDNDRESQRLTARTRPPHRKDANLIRIAQAAKRRNNDVLIISNTRHIQKLDPILHTDRGVRVLSPGQYTNEFC